MTKIDYRKIYGSSLYDDDGYEREVHCHKCGALLYISEALQGDCSNCREQEIEFEEYGENNIEFNKNYNEVYKEIKNNGN